MKKVGIIICHRYQACAGGKCLRSLRNREGAFARYHDEEVELVGYPPCPHLLDFCDYIPTKYGLEVVVGTHPIAENYHLTHQELGTWQAARWQEFIADVLPDQAIRLAYD